MLRKPSAIARIDKCFYNFYDASVNMNHLCGAFSRMFFCAIVAKLNRMSRVSYSCVKLNYGEICRYTWPLRGTVCAV